MGEGQPDANRPPIRRRATVQEAAEALGVTVEAVRGRIKRGKLKAEREKDGSVYVWLDADQIATGHDQPTTGPQPATDRLTDQSALIESLLEQVAYMREQLAEERGEETRGHHHGPTLSSQRGASTYHPGARSPTRRVRSPGDGLRQPGGYRQHSEPERRRSGGHRAAVLVA